MSTACLIVVIAGVSPANPSLSVVGCGSLTIVVNTSLPFSLKRDRDELRTAYKTVLRRSADRFFPDPFLLTPDLVRLYAELTDPKSIRPTERLRMLRALQSRLEKMRDKLNRSNLRRKAELVRRRRRLQLSPRLNRLPRRQTPAEANGPLITARANQLIDLIQSTICPESWSVNGGRGTIRFYAPLNVLVIRATGEVHHQIGGTLPILKK
ncbi:MAG: hypothetical protein IID45_06460 [Planctomycetes bacterium]|nr:hypothetical protein [Planctomycetota bacterium]